MRRKKGVEGGGGCHIRWEGVDADDLAAIGIGGLTRRSAEATADIEDCRGFGEIERGEDELSALVTSYMKLIYRVKVSDADIVIW